MTHTTHRPAGARKAMIVGLGLTLAGCSLGGSFVPSPEQVPQLEARVASRPGDTEAAVRLGAAYQAAGRLDDAAPLLERARAADPDDANAAFFLGVVYEGQNRPGEAIEAYVAFRSLAPGTRAAQRVDGRIRLLRRQQLRASIREAVAMEQSLAQTPSPATVAVFPFRFDGTDERLQPLGRALAEMLSTDLAQTDRLTVLERVRIQALLDEVALGQSGAVDEGSAVRGGRLLGAGRVVQGQVSGNEARLRLEAAVVEVGRGTEPGTVAQEDAGANLFAMEKALAFQIYEEMGISLTPAEREAVNRRFTENLQALLAFGRGLQAADQGNYQQARQFFSEAASLDPGFDAASELAVETGTVVDAGSLDADDLVGDLIDATLEEVLDEQVQAVADQAADAGARDPVQEALGTEGVGKTPPTPVTVILKRPGGER